MLGCVLLASGCGSDASLNVSSGGTKSCAGGDGPQVTGTVSMPNGRLALAPSLLDRVARLFVAPAQALSGSLEHVGGGVVVQLVELRQEDLDAGADPDVLESGKTNGKGAYCMGLRADTDRSVCRYVLQVGSRDDGTLTRAFVFGDEDTIDIDYRSEAAVQAVLAHIPPAMLCDFDQNELRSIYEAVLAAPGTIDAENASDANAVAATVAINDDGVQQAIAAALD
jgi:hypothetical protein